MLSDEMWQEFYIEANENLDALEQLLLNLEQHPDDITILNECFRNMHNIKGAAGYMGLKGISSLSHAVENIFDKLRKSEMQFSTHVINKSFEVIDFLRKLLKGIDADKTMPDEASSMVERIRSFIDSEIKFKEEKIEEELDTKEAVTYHEEKVEEAPKIVEQEDDKELFSIFTDEMQNLFANLLKMRAKEVVSLAQFKTIIKDMHRVINFIGLDGLLKSLTEIEAKIDDLYSGENLKKENYEEILVSLKDLFDPVIGPIYLETDYSKSGEICREDDPELFSIFLSYVKEQSSPIRFAPENPDEEWSRNCQEAISSIKNAAHYMDYVDMGTIMEEATERLAETLTLYGKGDPFDPEPIKNIWEKMLHILPELGKDETSLTEEIDLDSELKLTSEQFAMEPASADDFNIDIPGGFADMPAETTIIPTEQSSAEILRDFTETTEFETSIDDLFGDFLPETPISAVPQTTILQQLAPAKEQIPQVPQKASQAEKEVVKRTFSEIKEAPKQKVVSIAQTVRVDLDRVEKLLADVSELVVLKSSFAHVAEDIKNIYKFFTEELKIETQALKSFKNHINKLVEQNTLLNRTVYQIQENVMRMRMLPVSLLFDRFPRMVRDISQSLNKKVTLNMIGADTELDKRVIEQMVDPLMHILRNAIDHGVESPEARKKAGKPDTGQITLAAAQEGSHVIIRIIDDGKGLDRDKILAKAVALNLIRVEDSTRLTDEQVWEFIFAPGFSTSQNVTEVSGRGVGMDVVRKNVEKINGDIKLISIPGEGTEFSIRIPLTLAIIPSMLVKVGRQVMALPLDVVIETTRIFTDEIGTAEGFELIPYRQKTLPIIRLSNIFKGTGAELNPKKLFVVVIKIGDIEAGIAAEILVGQQDIVVKPLSEFLTEQPGFAGATIMGDGSIGLILDLPSVFEKAKLFILKRQQFMEDIMLQKIGEERLTLH